MSDSTPTRPHVLEAIESVQAALSRLGIDKSSHNSGQNFSFRGIDAAMAALSPLLVAARMAVLPFVNESVREKSDSAAGKVQFSSIVTVTFQLVSLVDGSKLETCFTGEGKDAGDKANSKALAMAYKYFVFQTFCVPVEGQDDADASNPEPVAVARPKVSRTTPAEDVAQRAADVAMVDASFQTVLKAVDAANTQEEVAALRVTAGSFAKHPAFDTLKASFKAATARTAPKV